MVLEWFAKPSATNNRLWVRVPHLPLNKNLRESNMIKISLEVKNDKNSTEFITTQVLNVDDTNTFVQTGEGKVAETLRDMCAEALPFHKR